MFERALLHESYHGCFCLKENLRVYVPTNERKGILDHCSINHSLEPKKRGGGGRGGEGEGEGKGEGEGEGEEEKGVGK